MSNCKEITDKISNKMFRGDNRGGSIWAEWGGPCRRSHHRRSRCRKDGEKAVFKRMSTRKERQQRSESADPT